MLDWNFPVIFVQQQVFHKKLGATFMKRDDWDSIVTWPHKKEQEKNFYWSNVHYHSKFSSALTSSYCVIPSKNHDLHQSIGNKLTNFGQSKENYLTIQGQIMKTVNDFNAHIDKRKYFSIKILLSNLPKS